MCVSKWFSALGGMCDAESHAEPTEATNREPAPTAHNTIDAQENAAALSAGTPRHLSYPSPPSLSLFAVSFEQGKDTSDACTMQAEKLSHGCAVD
jgi:hypothetical protein